MCCFRDNVKAHEQCRGNDSNLMPPVGYFQAIANVDTRAAAQYMLPKRTTISSQSMRFLVFSISVTSMEDL
jgi:hypothetical protein